MHATDFNTSKIFKMIHEIATLERNLQLDGLKF